MEAAGAQFDRTLMFERLAERELEPAAPEIGVKALDPLDHGRFLFGGRPLLGRGFRHGLVLSMRVAVQAAPGPLISSTDLSSIRLTDTSGRQSRASRVMSAEAQRDALERVRNSA
jgi:hypothetical protein